MPRPGAGNMNEFELSAAVKAVRESAPPGMGDYTVRLMAKAALEAAEEVRRRQAKIAAHSGEQG